MILVVVGTQEPFDRLIRYIDEWSMTSGYNDIEAQISNAKYKPSNFKWFDFLPQSDFDEKFKNASFIVSHAGMGSIISAMQFSKPIIVLPRLAKFKEHRNDHQLATALSFSKLGYVKAAYDKENLFELLNTRQLLLPPPPISQYASTDLLNAVSQFIKGN